MWIKKAADKKLPPANYNLALLLNNGWGTDWNPYEAYRRFNAAAKDSMPEALFAVGLLNTDNLIVPKNYKKAFDLIKASANMGFKPAKEILTEFYKIGYGGLHDSSNVNNDVSESGQQNTRITFFDIQEDSSRKIDDLTLLRDLIKEQGEDFSKNLGIKIPADTTLRADSSVIKVIVDAAENGSPEALALLGRCYEKGTGVKKDRVQAAVQYIRAFRLDSQNGSRLLWSLLQDNSFYDELKQRLLSDDVHAQFAWASLTALKLSNQLTDNDAFDLLTKAAGKKYIPAVIELGMCYYSGIFVSQDKLKAESIWKMAADEGSSEARVRMAIAHIQNPDNINDHKNDLQVLSSASEEGSLIAVAALGYCYLTGTGVGKNKALAVQYYRKAAQRGSRGAHNALMRIYDEIRPSDNEFLVLDQDE